MSEHRIAVAPKGAQAEIVDWLVSIGSSPDAVDLTASGAMIPVASVDAWIGVPSPDDDMVWVNTNAPEATPGETSHWLNFRPSEWHPSPEEPTCCWTSGLLVIRARTA